MKTPAASALLIAFALALAGPAGAEDGDSKPKPKEPVVMLNPVGLPVVVDGRLVNYVFVTVKLNLAPKADIAALQAQEPYFRDALVRAGSRTPFVRRDTYMALDDARVRAAVMQAATAIAGPGKVISAQIVKEQAQHYAGLPTPPAAKR